MENMKIYDRRLQCKFCGNPTAFTVTEMCNDCLEVEKRINTFISNKKGLDFIVRKVRSEKIKVWQDKWLKEIDRRHVDKEITPYPVHTDSIISSITSILPSEVWVETMTKRFDDPLSTEIIEDAKNNEFLWLGD